MSSVSVECDAPKKRARLSVTATFEPPGGSRSSTSPDGPDPEIQTVSVSLLDCPEIGLDTQTWRLLDTPTWRLIIRSLCLSPGRRDNGIAVANSAMLRLWRDYRNPICREMLKNIEEQTRGSSINLLVCDLVDIAPF